jgi:malate:Na+ symporter
MLYSKQRDKEGFIMKMEAAIASQNPRQKGFAYLTSWTIGSVPLPLYLILGGLIYVASIQGKLPADMIGGIAIMMIMGIVLGEIGLKVPILRDIGGPAILSIFVPSIMVFYHLLNVDSMKAMTSFMKGSNFLYFYIACLITGSILGMLRVVLVQGFLRMFIPILVGSIGSIVAGTSVGMMTGLGMYHSFFYVVIPIISGGLGEGILPLSMAYSEIMNQPYESFIPHLVPAAMLGNAIAIMIAGGLRTLGAKKPQLTGNGVLVRTGDDERIKKAQNIDKPVDFSLMGAGLLLACCFYIWGQLASKFIPIPAPIIMIFSAALVKALGIMPEKMEQGAYHMYKFVAANLTWALLIGVGALYTPWNDVIAAVSPAYIATVAAAVIAMIASGFYVGKLMNMYPVESALVTACHSGLGGTGDVAILSAANRIELMPFAQISTRLGGACMVVIAAILMRLSL